MPIHARTARQIFAFASAFALAHGAVAQVGLEPRVLDLFDFEDPTHGNLEDDPMGWRKLEGPGLPHYLNGKFDQTVKASGQYSYRLDLDGGSLIYRYPAGRVPVRANGLYRVSVLARTTKLDHARAAITAWLVDEDGKAIDGTRVRQTLAPDSGTAWKPLSLDIANNSANAKSLVVEFGLLQPAQLNLDRPNAPDLLVEDIKGSAWFDDLSIMEAPDIRLATPNAGNFFDAGEPMLVRIGLRDRIASDLTVSATVRDVDGKMVFQKTGGWTWNSDGVANQTSSMIELPITDPGWYRVDFTLTSGSRVVSEVSTNVVRFAEANSLSHPDRRFGFVATDLPLSTWSYLPETLESLAAGRVKLSVWDEHTAIESTTDAPAFDRVLDAFERRGITIIGCLRALPPSIAESLGGSEFERALNSNSTTWKSQLAYLVSRHAGHITSWQLLDDSSAERIAREPLLQKLHDEMHRELTSLLEAPDLALPWPAWAELEKVSGQSIALSVPDSILPDQLPLYINSLKQSDAHRQIAILLNPIDQTEYGLAAQRRDLAQRIVYALAAGAERIELPLPLEGKRIDGELKLDPSPLAPTIRTLFRHLADARFAGKVPISTDVEAFLFERDQDDGVLVLWNRSGKSRVKALLGGTPQRVDLNGRSTPLRIAPSASKEVELEISSEPILITGVDPALLRIQATVGLDNAFIESSFQPHMRRLRFVNAYNQAITGSIALRGPTGWTCSLAGGQFNLNPGEAFDEPVTIDLPSNAISGEQVMTVDLRINGREDVRVTLPIPVHVSLDEVGLQTIAQRNGREIFVQQVITNYGSTPIDYTAFVLCPGAARQERLISQLAPGMSMLKKYRFTAPSAPTSKLRSGLRELDGSKMINEEVTIN